MDPKQFWQYLTVWYSSDALQAPLLVTAPPHTNWQLLIQRCWLLVDTTPQAQKGTHPDIIQVGADEPSLKIKDIRMMRRVISSTSLTAHRLILIPQAERLLREAANALLKALEDSSPANRFMLLTSYPSRLLPTIISRCEKLRVPAELAPRTMAADKTPEEILSAIAYAGRKNPLSAEELQDIAQSLPRLVQLATSEPALYRALMRLRDYHKIKQLRGNEKLAADVLLASLVELRHSSSIRT